MVAVSVAAATGPSTVECGELEPATCDGVWRRAADRHDDGLLAFLPVTGARVSEMTEENLCGTIVVERWIFAIVVNHYCH
jgi:hypothetical protein